MKLYLLFFIEDLETRVDNQERDTSWEMQMYCPTILESNKQALAMAKLQYDEVVGEIMDEYEEFGKDDGDEPPEIEPFRIVTKSDPELKEILERLPVEADELMAEDSNLCWVAVQPHDQYTICLVRDSGQDAKKFNLGG